MAYKYLGYGVTDENGVAKLDHDASGTEISHSYTGVGAGEVDVVASLDNASAISDSSIQSEPFEVMDYIVYDTGKTGRDATKWTNSNSVSVVTDENGTTLTKTGTGSYTSNIWISGDFEAILQLKTNGTAIRVGVINGNNQVTQAIRMNTSESYFKISRSNGVISAKESNNGTTWTNVGLESSNVGSEDCKFTFYIIGSNERSITYHDLTILPI